MLIVELIADCRVDLHFCARTPCLLSALGLEAPIPAGPKCRVAGLVGNSGRAQGGGASSLQCSRLSCAIV